ncbi:hypothetical protein IWQ62_000617 [Dispira parvispora]|uniref:Uncharacterized protein n=1 Tax=Dispira parvispora TaxID=1520584 RepID=A0A9W8AZP9_9FUNG|nr:hypothetical protein IWQ62_000617 [Dispira parvispora]
MADQQKRRPGGLKRTHGATASTAEKAESSATPQTKQSRIVTEAEKESSQMSIPLELPEGADDLEELRHIYDAAFATLKTDSEHATVLFRGVIHECDRLLRLQAEQTPPSTPGLPPAFYWIYGMALFCLSELTEDQDALGFLELAEEHFNHGLELIDSASPSTRAKYDEVGERLQLTDIQSRLTLACAKTRISQARILATQDMVKSAKTRRWLMSAAVEGFNKLIDHARQQGSEEMRLAGIPWLIQKMELIQSYAELLRDQAEVDDLLQPGVEQLKKVLSDNSDNPKLWNSLGLSYWSLARFYLDQAEDVEDDEEKENDTKHQELLEKAKPYLAQCFEALQKSEQLFADGNPELSLLLLTLGEVSINLGNCLEDGEDREEEDQEPEQRLCGLTQTELYQRAVDSFKKARQVGGDDYMLPEHFEVFLQDWEQEMHDD